MDNGRDSDSSSSTSTSGSSAGEYEVIVTQVCERAKKVLKKILLYSLCAPQVGGSEEPQQRAEVLQGVQVERKEASVDPGWERRGSVEIKKAEVEERGEAKEGKKEEDKGGNWW